MEETIKNTKELLSQKVMELETKGRTAMGPAILTSIAMASKGGAGSIVVICTDGCANIGLGSFNGAKTEDEITKVEEFYEQIGQYAKISGVTVNIVSFEGENCNL